MTWRWDDSEQGDIRAEDSVADYLSYTGEQFYPEFSPGRGVEADTSRGEAEFQASAAPRPLHPSHAAGRTHQLVNGRSSRSAFACVVCADLGCSHCPGVDAA